MLTAAREEAAALMKEQAKKEAVEKLDSLISLNEYEQAALYLKTCNADDVTKQRVDIAKYADGLIQNNQIFSGYKIHAHLGHINEQLMLDFHQLLLAVQNQSAEALNEAFVRNEEKHNVQQFALLLWKRFESCADTIYRSSSSFYAIIYNIQPYVEGFEKKNKIGNITTWFFELLAEKLDSVLGVATKNSRFLTQILQAGYPKLLRIFHDLNQRILLLSKNDLAAEKVLLVLHQYEVIYVSRSLTRLYELVNHDVDVEKFVRGIARL